MTAEVKGQEPQSAGPPDAGRAAGGSTVLMPVNAHTHTRTCTHTHSTPCRVDHSRISFNE